MSKTWYPVIDYEKCIECGACTDKCKKGVYDLSKLPTPVVVEPENCVHGCHGCGNLCPNEAIQYVGDVGKQKPEKCCCSNYDEQTQESVDCCCSHDDENGGCC